MTQTFADIDLAALPPAEVLAREGEEEILARRKAELVELARAEGGDALALAVQVSIDAEGEVLAKTLEAGAWEEFTTRGEFIDRLKGQMLAYATGATLEHLGAFYGVERLIAIPGDPDATPPIPNVLETDAALRRRIQLAPEGLSAAGTPGAFLFNSLSVSGVRDAAVISPDPIEVDIYALGFEGDGTPSAEVLAAIDAMHAEWRAVGIVIRIHPATIVPYTLEADLKFLPGPSPAVVLAAAQEAAEAVVVERSRLGFDVPRSALLAALHQPGVHSVVLIEPAEDLVIEPSEASVATSITIRDAGVDV